MPNRSAAVSPRIDRATPDDVINLETDSATAPMQIGALLRLESGTDFDPVAFADLLGRRVACAPRMRQRLQAVPLGCGRPIWVDDEGFDPSQHITITGCCDPDDQRSVLDLAGRVIARRLDRSRPLWAATLVTDRRSRHAALIIVFHHVLADGMAGLGILADLVDGPDGIGRPPAVPDLRPVPGTREVLLDAWRERIGVLADWRRLTRRAKASAVELAPASERHPPRTSLNRPTGPRRRFEVVTTDLEAVHAAARGQGASVNDLVLAAVAPALRDLLRRRGEEADRFVISVPVSRRTEASSGQTGNDVGAALMEIGAGGDPAERLRSTAALSRRLKQLPKEEDLFAPMVRALGRLHLLRPFLEHQHMVNTLVTNLRGPGERLGIGGTPISDVIALSAITGNVTVAFAVISYAGSLTISIVADPEACPDLPLVRDALARHLAELTVARR